MKSPSDFSYFIMYSLDILNLLILIVLFSIIFFYMKLFFPQFYNIIEILFI